MSTPTQENTSLPEEKLNAVSAETLGYDAIALAAQNILHKRELPDILQSVCEEVCKALGADRSLVEQVVSMTPEAYTMKLLTSFNMPSDYLSAMNARTKPNVILSDTFSSRDIEVVQDPSNDPRVFSQEEHRKAEHATMCVIPLYVDGNEYGALVLFHQQRAEYNFQQRQVASALGGLVSIAIEKFHFLSEAHKHADQLAILNRISRTISGNLNPDEVLLDIARAAAELTGGGKSRILLYDNDSDSFQEVATWGELSSPNFKKINFKVGFSGIAVRTGLPQIIDDLHNDPRVFSSEWMKSNNLHSCIAFPIQLDRQAIVIISYADTVNFFDDSAVEVLQELAPHAAIAFMNAELHEDVRERAERLGLVGRIAQVVSSELEPEELFNSLAGEIRQVVSCHRFVLASFDIEKRFYRYCYESADVSSSLTSEKEFRSRILVDKIYESKRPLYIPNLLEYSEGGERNLKLGYRSVMMVPVSIEGKILSLMVLASKETDAFSAADEELLVTLAPQLGTAIKNALLYREAEVRATRLEVVGEIARVVASELEPDELFRTIAHEIQKKIPAERCVVGSYIPETFRLFNWVTESKFELPLVTASDIRKLRYYQRVYLDQLPMNIPDLGEVPTPRAKQLVKTGLRSNLVVPVLQDSKCIAHIGLASTKAGAYSDEDVSLLMSIAGHLGTAIRNANLYKESEERNARLELSGEIAGSWVRN